MRVRLATRRPQGLGTPGGLWTLISILGERPTRRLARRRAAAFGTWPRGNAMRPRHARSCATARVLATGVSTLLDPHATSATGTRTEAKIAVVLAMGRVYAWPPRRICHGAPPRRAIVMKIAAAHLQRARAEFATVPFARLPLDRQRFSILVRRTRRLVRMGANARRAKSIFSPGPYRFPMGRRTTDLQAP